MTAKQIRDLEQERNAYKRLYEQAVQDRADEHVELHKKINILNDFVESITDAEGPFGLFNGTSIVYAAYDTMAKMKGVTNGG